MSLYDGQAVFLPDGEQGKIIASSETGCHVLVTTGSLTNEVLLLSTSDLTALSHFDVDGLDDSLEIPETMETFASLTQEELADEIVNTLYTTLRNRIGIEIRSSLATPSDDYFREGALAVLQRAIELIEE